MLDHPYPRPLPHGKSHPQEKGTCGCQPLLAARGCTALALAALLPCILRCCLALLLSLALLPTVVLAILLCLGLRKILLASRCF